MFFEDEKKYYKEQQLKLKRERTLKKKAQQAKYIEMLLKSKEARKIKNDLSRDQFQD